MKKNIVTLIVFAILLSLNVYAVAESSGVVSYFNFEQTSGQLIDVADGDSNSTAVFKIGQTNTGKIGNAWCNATLGGNHHVSIPISDFPVGDTDRTFNIWRYDYNLSGGGNYQYWDYGDNAGTRYALGQWSSGGGAYNMYIVVNNGDYENQNISRAVSWTMYTWVYTGADNMIKIYVNGSSKAEKAFAGDLVTQSTKNFTLWSLDWTWVNPDGMNLCYDEFGVWNRSLSASEVANLYTYGNSGLSYPFVANPAIQTSTISNPRDYFFNTLPAINGSCVADSATNINASLYINNVFSGSVNITSNITLAFSITPSPQPSLFTQHNITVNCSNPTSSIVSSVLNQYLANSSGCTGTGTGNGTTINYLKLDSCLIEVTPGMSYTC